MKPVQRIQQNLLATSERRLLNWICPRLPHWVTPDMLTALGFLGSVISAAGYILSNWDAAWLYLAISGYFINWFGDSLDGSLARHRNIERPSFGYFLDHSTDSLANLILVFGIGLSPYIRVDIALMGLAGYYLLSIHTFLSARVTDEFPLTYLAAGPTEMRLFLISMTFAMLLWGPDATSGLGYGLFNNILLMLALIMLVLFIGKSVLVARALLRVDDNL